jgi:uncharacterized protein YrrD
MLQNIKSLYGYRLAASNGHIGHVQDFYFDDKAWVLRYLVADTGSWLSGRQVLLTPHAFGELDRAGKSLAINLTRKQIEDSPSIESHKPVSRQYEIDYYHYYGWPVYWDGGGMWGLGGYPVIIAPSKDQLADQPQHHQPKDLHLRSSKALAGYSVQVTDREIGSLSGFLVDDKNWAIRDLVVKVGNWFSHKQVLIPSDRIERISYEEAKIFARPTQEDIERTKNTGVAKNHGPNPETHFYA